MTFEHGKWYEINSDMPLKADEEDGVLRSPYVLLGKREQFGKQLVATGPAMGIVSKFSDGELRANAGGYLGVKWTHWSPLLSADDIPVVYTEE